MARFVSTVVLVSLAALVCEAHSSAPAYSVRITRAGIDAFIDGVADESAAYAMKLPVLDADVTASGVDLRLTGMRISQFERPRIAYTLQEPNKFLAKVSFPKIVIQGSARASRRGSTPAQHDDGNFEFNFTDARLDLSFTLGTFENGTPSVEQFECASSRGPAKVSMQNFREKFAVEALASGARAVWPAFNTQTCTVLKQVLTDRTNKALAGFPNVLSFSKALELRGQLKLALTQDSLEVGFFEKSLKDLASPWQPTRCDMSVDGSPQARLTVSDALFNNALDQAYNKGGLNFTLSPSSSPVLYKSISLDCGKDGECLGNVAKKLPERFGKDARVEVQMKAPGAPTLEFKDGKAAMRANWLATFHIAKNKPGAKRTLVASGLVTVNGSLQPHIKNETASARLSVEDIQFKADQPEMQAWEQDARNIFKDIVQTYVNDTLFLKGISLPRGLKVDAASVKFTQHCVHASGSLNSKAAMSSE